MIAFGVRVFKRAYAPKETSAILNVASREAAPTQRILGRRTQSNSVSAQEVITTSNSWLILKWIVLIAFRIASRRPGTENVW